MDKKHFAAIATLAFVLSLTVACMAESRPQLQKSLDEVVDFPGAVLIDEQYDPGEVYVDHVVRPSSLVRYYQTTGGREEVLQFYSEKMGMKKGWHMQPAEDGLLLWKIESRAVWQQTERFDAPVITRSIRLSWGCGSTQGGGEVASETSCFRLTAPAAIEPVRVVVHVGSRGFSSTILQARANYPVEIALYNDDRSSAHGFSIYRDEAGKKPLLVGLSAYGGPPAEWTFVALPGTYYFRCDEHPDLEHGKFIFQ